MAGFGRDGNALLPMRYVANLFKDQTLAQLKSNFMTQRIWPYEVYPGYRIENERRRYLAEQAEKAGKKGPWYSTGEGVTSFEGEVIKAGEDGIVTMAFRFNDYLQYVDLGVGAGRSADDVDRGKKANYSRRYIHKWIPRSGKTHRPAIAMELRHLATRLENYVQDFYCKTTEVKIVETFEGLTIFV